jgi:hypothetical protein
LTKQFSFGGATSASAKVIAEDVTELCANANIDNTEIDWLVLGGVNKATIYWGWELGVGSWGLGGRKIVTQLMPPNKLFDI